MKHFFRSALFSCLLMPSTVSAQQATAQQVGVAQPLIMGEIHSISSTVMQGNRRIVVRLPADYRAKPDRRYPVVYVIDGGPEQDFPHLAGLAQSTEVNGTFDPLILVGIETVKRREEITPPVKDPRPYVAELKAVPGGSATFREFIRREVKPWIESRFRTSGHDAVMGESLAGLFVIETLFKEPDLFDDYIAVSPSMWWEDMFYGTQADSFLRKLPTGKRRLYLTLADEGYRHGEGVSLLVSSLRKSAPKDLKWLFVPQGETETHASIYHGAALDAFRAFYGTPSRIYLPGPLLSGEPIRAKSAIEQQRLKQDCTRENSRSTTPAQTRNGHEAITFECLLYDLGPRPSAGNLGRSDRP
ncbi:MAG: alpha/beta hydrolase-fold protein [Pseudomonadota bacterium]